ncbi:hypothetical protein FIBSPDRAFT_858418 [Athelia psychrophila]|uniref:Stress-response A/B barrel domain-containing protein n=1 Tax=Athelia psychrophila TaxID=1759441 RepID=A0A166LYR6_9AGAM|nr:hypothetical protein FIBSPDRAFT_858418 [Fibularhizoctonia sp. CBS 109695]
MSIEAFTRGLQVIFVLTFNSVEDYTYYVNEDAVHLAFAAELGNAVSDIWVGDFVNEAPPY